VLLRPHEHLAQAGRLLDVGHRGVDVLRLPALAVRRHDHAAGDRVRDRRAVLAPQQVQARVDAGGGPGAREDRVVVDVEDVRVDGDAG
jgi:hypothetical protein